MRLILILVLAMLSGCASYVSRGDHFLENGDYDDAIQMYETALSRGNDDDARIGLQKARDGWLSKKLIEVRLQRLAGSTTPANDMLNGILQKEVSWSMFPSGAAMFTQNEECDYAAQDVLAGAKKSIAENKTLRAALSLTTYRAFFQDIRKAEFAAAEKEMRSQGASNCAKLTKQIRPTDYYYGLFTQKYCTYFGAKSPDLTRQKKHELGHLFSGLDLTMNGLPAGSHIPETMRDLFFEELKATPWFDNDGLARLKIDGTASFYSSHDQENTNLIHHYSVQVPVTTQHRETRYNPKDPANARRVHEANDSIGFFTVVGSVLQLTGALMGVNTSPSAGSSEHDNGDGTVTITETHYEPSPREMSYSAIDHRQVFNFASTTRLALENVPVEVSVEKKFEHHTIENHTSMPEIGLQSSEPDLLSDDQWVRPQIEGMTTILKLKAMNAWDRKYCSDAPNVSADLVFRCWHVGSTHLPSSFTNWFNATFGVTPEQSEQLLGAGRLGTSGFSVR